LWQCFTSIKLGEDLLQDNIYLCRTTRANTRDFPRELATNNAEVKRLHQELLFRQKNDLVATVWKDKRLVHFLSTQKQSC